MMQGIDGRAIGARAFGPVGCPTKAPVFARGLAIMATLAERLPVAAIPKQCPVPFMGTDMINDGRKPAAPRAGWMLL